jgi:hypothetical protein
MNIDASFLRPGYQTEQKEGFYAEFNPAGQLIHFGYYQDGKPQTFVLYLTPEELQGRVENIKEFSLEQARDRGWDDGDYESGRTSNDADLFRFWVEDQIRDIYESTDTRLRCSFCGKTQSEVEKLIAGPQVYICNECIQLCNEILEEEKLYTSTPNEPTM